MPRGGARPGAGRPKQENLRRTAYYSPIREGERKIAERLPWLVDQLMTLAAGVLVETTTLDGGTVVYQKPPDRAACEYLLDRVMGKPAQPFEVRERAMALAAELGMTVEEVLAEAERVMVGRG